MSFDSLSYLESRLKICFSEKWDPNFELEWRRDICEDKVVIYILLSKPKEAVLLLERGYEIPVTQFDVHAMLADLLSRLLERHKTWQYL